MNKYYYFSLVALTLLLTSACSQQRYQQSDNRRSPAYSTQQNARQVAVPAQGQRNTRPTISSQQRAPQSSPAVNNPTRNLMVKIAKSTLGVPYKWGGNSPRQGFDCSGLMSYVHKNASGLNLPRTAAKQRDNSRTISYAQLQPGDMLFFKTSKTSNHVGVYIGDRKFIHAPSGGKRVTVATMDSAYWHKRFVKFGTYL